MIAGLVAGGVLWLAMVGVSCYGWLSLPADAVIPVHFGTRAYNIFVPKRMGLLVHPAVGALLFVMLVVTQVGAHKSESHRPGAVILPLAMCVLLAVQAGAIRVARRRSGF